MIATNESTPTTVVLARRVDLARVISWLGLAVPLLVSALLNLWNLAQNGYSNLYYSVAVQSMTESLSNFFFGSYDAGGFITVDKPPVALWMQAISARIFGFSSLSVLLPEALAGVASVGLLYYLVRRLFGPLAGSVAALALALTPIAVAVERTNNTDTWLMFFLLLAAWALSRALETGRFALLALALSLVGVAFNVKMLAAFVVLPAFYLVYLLAAQVSLPKRIGFLALGSLFVFGVALSWPLIVDAIPANQRPWIGGSQTNSVLDLALNYNGLGRVDGQEGVGRGGGFGGGPGGGFNRTPPNNGGRDGNNGGVRPNFGNGGRGGLGGFNLPGFGNGSNLAPNNNGSNGNSGNGAAPNGLTLPGIGLIPGGPIFQIPGLQQFGSNFGAGPAGATRLFSGQLAGLWTWLLPLALFGLVALVPTLRRKFPLEPRGAALVLWAGWLICYGVIFSIAEGIFHPYYLVMLAPGAAALVGIGVSALVGAYRRSGWQAWLLPIALLATAAWQVNVLAEYPAWGRWIAPPLLVGSIVAAATLVAARLLTTRTWRRLAPGLVGIGMVALLVGPAAWAVTPVLAGPSNASLPTAGPEALNQNDPNSWTRLSDWTNSELISFLKRESVGYTYLLAVTNSQQASSMTLVSGKSVLATGGFMGSDPALTAPKLAQMVADKQVRFVMGLSGGFASRGGSGTGSVSQWVQSNCVEVDPSQYGGQSNSRNGVGGFGGMFGFGASPLYDCAAH